jgi:hypothetical protein
VIRVVHDRHSERMAWLQLREYSIDWYKKRGFDLSRIGNW